MSIFASTVLITSQQVYDIRDKYVQAQKTVDAFGGTAFARATVDDLRLGEQEWNALCNLAGCYSGIMAVTLNIANATHEREISSLTRLRADTQKASRHWLHTFGYTDGSRTQRNMLRHAHYMRQHNGLGHGLLFFDKPSDATLFKLTYA